jgi:hypothetical protein
MSEENAAVEPRKTTSDQTGVSSTAGTVDEDKNRDRSQSQDTADTHLDISSCDSSASSSGGDNDMDEICDEVGSEKEYGDEVPYSSKSSVSLSSKASSSTAKPVSTKSVSSHQSSSSSSTATKDENGPTAADLKHLQERLQQSLEEEKRLLGIQQQLLVQMEEIEHSIIQAEHEERAARVASQRAHILNLMDRARETERV